MEEQVTIIEKDTLKEKVCRAMLMQLQRKGFTREQLNDVENAFFLKTKDMNFTSTSKALIVSDKANESLIQKFYATKFIEGLSKRTLKQYCSEVKRFQKVMNVNLVDVTTDQIRGYLAYLMANGVSRRTVDNERRYLNAFYNWLFEEGIILFSPAKKVKNIKWQKKVLLPFSEEEVEAMREHADSTRDRALIEVLLSTGCRVSEITTARLRWLDIQAGTLLVVGKGSKERIVYLNAASRHWMKKYLKERVDNNDCLFCSLRAPYDPLGKSAIETAIRELGQRCGIDKAHPHRFRRTAASWASKRGMPIQQIKEMLGHSDIETTMLYAVTDPKAIQQSHEKYLGG